MLQTAKFELEQSIPKGDSKTGLGPMRITITSCMANPVRTSRMSAEALANLVEQHEWTTYKCEVGYQDFDVVPMYSQDRVDRLGDGLVTESDADTVTRGIREVEELARSDDIQRVVVDTVSMVQVERTIRAVDAARTVDTVPASYELE